MNIRVLMNIRVFSTLLTCAALSLFACIASADPRRGTITGQVRDSKGKPLAHARVTLLDIGETTITDARGIYVFTAEDSRTCSVRIELTGYKTLALSAAIPPNATSHLDVVLEAVKTVFGRRRKPGEKDKSIVEIITAQGSRTPPDLSSISPQITFQGDSALHSTARSR